MATISRTIPLQTTPDAVWDALADVGAPHERLARDFVVDAHLDGDLRTVTFAGGVVATELIVSVDTSARRLAYSVVDSPLGLRHHHAVFTVVDDDAGGCRLEWVVDASPDTAVPALEGMVDLGVAAMARTLGAAEVRAAR